MRQRSKPIKEKAPDKPTYKLQLPKKRVTPERQKIRQLLRSMLPMEDEQRQLKEEQNLFK